LKQKKVVENLDFFINNNGKHTVDYFHKKLGKIMWEKCGMARSSNSLKSALKEIPLIRENFWKNARVLGSADEYNPYLERALRIADYLEFAEVMACDALERSESCGGHFRTESQTSEGEAQRNDENFCHVSAWQYNGKNKPILHKEKLVFENIVLAQRSYK